MVGPRLNSPILFPVVLTRTPTQTRAQVQEDRKAQRNIRRHQNWGWFTVREDNRLFTCLRQASLPQLSQETRC